MGEPARKPNKQQVRRFEQEVRRFEETLERIRSLTRRFKETEDAEERGRLGQECLKLRSDIVRSIFDHIFALDADSKEELRMDCEHMEAWFLAMRMRGPLSYEIALLDELDEELQTPRVPRAKQSARTEPDAPVEIEPEAAKLPAIPEEAQDLDPDAAKSQILSLVEAFVRAHPDRAIELRDSVAEVVEENRPLSRERTLKLREAAEWAGVSHPTLLNLLEKGQLGKRNDLGKPRFSEYECRQYKLEREASEAAKPKS